MCSVGMNRDAMLLAKHRLAWHRNHLSGLSAVHQNPMIEAAVAICPEAGDAGRE